MEINLGVGYIRFSSHKQIDNHSVEMQKTHILQCAEKHGYYIQNFFVDEAVSGFNQEAGKRPGLIQLRDFVIDQRIDAIFVYDPSRLTRQISDFQLVIYDQIIEVHPTCVVFDASSGNKLDFGDPMTQLRLIFSRQESEIKSSRAKDAQAKLLSISNGNNPVRPGARLPFGYSQNNDGIIQNENSNVVLFIFFLASWGYSNQKIADVLNQAGILSPEKNA
ncbi:recombinase family protein [Aneurinibacillus tyrosinisolvens]|uniref:recombinase family protein n=1 Tax=Aneurinibacillus tyrosinisolvens TaxID=1443435 RepID=UPI00063EEBAA|nr:recombinase family protein [Aneurinibacillus tyrosinisolvens]